VFTIFLNKLLTKSKSHIIEQFLGVCV